MVFADGIEIEAFIRDDLVKPRSEQWLFYKRCEKIINFDRQEVEQCEYYLFQAIWSGVYNKFTFVDYDGKEHKVYKK